MAGRRHAPRPHRRRPARLIAPGALAGALLLVFAPWLWQLAGQRAERIRLAGARRRRRPHPRLGAADARARPAARRRRGARLVARPPPGARAAPLAVRQRLRRRRRRSSDALAEAAADIEELHGVRIELASARATCRSTTAVQQLVLAAREAMTNAAKFAGGDEISVYAEVRRPSASRSSSATAARLRPRAGPGRPPRAQRVDRGPDRARRRPGDDRSAPGEGTEIELTLPRRPHDAPRRARRRPRALPRRRARRAAAASSRSSARRAASPRRCR